MTIYAEGIGLRPGLLLSNLASCEYQPSAATNVSLATPPKRWNKEIPDRRWAYECDPMRRYRARLAGTLKAHLQPPVGACALAQAPAQHRTYFPRKLY